jgi:hypothetical protein
LMNQKKQNVPENPAAGKPLPEKEQRKVEPVWSWETEDVCNSVLPFKKSKDIC